MANTTNFGWETPDDTDLVKDGASAIRTLGSAIDTSLVDLKGGTTGQVLSKASNTDLDFTWTNGGDITEVSAGTGISGGGTSGAVTITNSMATAIDAKGDLIAGTGADAFSRLAVGTNGQYLIADSTTATGLKWGDVSAGAYTVLASGTLSNNSVTISSISGSYKDLYVLVNRPTGSAGDYLNFRVNGDTSANYRWIRAVYNSGAWNAGVDSFFDASGSVIPVLTTNTNVMFSMTIFDYAQTGYKQYQIMGQSQTYNSTFQFATHTDITAAITSVTIKMNDAGRTFTGGTYTLYGVK